MKRLLLIVLVVFITSQIQIKGQEDKGTSQPQTHDEVSYTYDNAGNRITRSIIKVSGPIITPKSGEIEEPEEVTGEREIHVYPNPVRDELTVEILKGDNEDNYRFFMFDISGKLIKENKQQGNGILPIEMSVYQRGTYILIIDVEDGKYEYKIIKE
jgi:hypothetical protein